MKNEEIYVVTMYRWGEKSKHSYLLGVYTKKHKAKKMAEEEEKTRGGKYEAEIIITELDSTKIKYLKEVDNV